MKKRDKKMSMREDVLEIKKEVKEMQEQSFAMELLKEDHKKNKRQFIIILVLIGLLALAMSYIVFLLNDIGTTTETEIIDIDDVEEIDNSHIRIGDNIWEKSN